MGIEVKVTPREYADRVTELQKKYQLALGLPVS
jgi:hypothetical protein